MRTKTDGRCIARITALLMTAVMLVSSVFFFADAAMAEPLPQEDNTASTVDENDGADSGEQDGEDPPAPVEPPVIKLKMVLRSGKFITLEWTGPAAFKDGLTADSCCIYIDGSEEGIPVPFEEGGKEETLSYLFTGQEYNAKYFFRVEYTYLDKDEKKTVSSDKISASTEYEQPQRRTIKSFKISKPPRLLRNGSEYNLRNYAGEPYYGYAIVQGSCVDDQGKYSYYCLADSGSYGRLVKVRMSDNKKIAVSGAHRFAHGNGMCFDSKRNKVVVASYDNGRRRLTFVDPDDLDNIYQLDVKFPKKLRDRLEYNTTGITALAYNAKYDCYITMQKSAHNIIIYDAETLKARAVAQTNFDDRFSGIFQSIDADDTYVYFLLSKDGSAQPHNLLVAFDWHSEKYADLLNGNSYEDIWDCGNGDGRHSAVIRITGANEIESLYHTDAGDGRGHFYLTNYHSDPKYRITNKKVKWKKVKKKVRVKVKWKKVWKKVKWKKVKTKNGKTRWKYKKKKVWKYKYKYKTKKVWKYRYKKVKTFKNYNRDNYVLDLGVF